MKQPDLVVFDVDGVIFPGQFIVALARRAGWLTCAQTVVDCLLFNVGRIRLEQLLQRVFWRLRGMNWSTVEETYRSMRITTGVRETISVLRGRDRRIFFLSAGIPAPLVRDLAHRLGAEDGAGIELQVADGRLTGKIFGQLARSDGKMRYLEERLREENIDWKNVTVIGDDLNNLPIMRKAGLGIGYHATYTVRSEVDVLVADDDLRLTLRPALDRRLGPPYVQTDAPRPLHREIFRKVLHLTAVAVPFVARNYLVELTIVLCVAMALYLINEFWRINGAYVPVLHHLHRLSMRRHEIRGAAMAPLTLALGVLCVLWLLPPELALSCVLIAAIADSAAALIGERYGIVRWPFNPAKTLEGTAAFFICAIFCVAVYLPLSQALVLAAFAASVESLPLRDWDNFVTPVATGIFGALLFF